MMGTTLVMAPPGDRLAAAVCRRVAHPIWHSRGRLPEALGIELDPQGRLLGGQFTPARARLPVRLADLTGVLFRPGPLWFAGRAASSPARRFIDYEIKATWAAWLAALPCPVVNRMGPSWFVDPQGYRAHLAADLARRLCLALHPDGAWKQSRRALRTRAASIRSAYWVGGEVLAASADAGEPVLAADLQARAATLNQWAAAAGLSWVRIDCVAADGWAIDGVDPMPSMAGEGDALLDAAGARLAKVIE